MESNSNPKMMSKEEAQALIDSVVSMISSVDRMIDLVDSMQKTVNEINDSGEEWKKSDQ